MCLHFVKGKVKVTQSCLTLCDPMYYTIHGILQARILEWIAFPSPGDILVSEANFNSLALFSYKSHEMFEF